MLTLQMSRPGPLCGLSRLPSPWGPPLRLCSGPSSPTASPRAVRSLWAGPGPELSILLLSVHLWGREVAERQTLITNYLPEPDDTRPGGIILLHVGTRNQTLRNIKQTAQTQDHKLASEVAGTDPIYLAHGLPTGRGCLRQTQRLERRQAAVRTWGVWQGCREVV